jgi:anti-sigma factor (TIGR02949 family)
MERIDAYDCREAFSRLDDYLDRELTPDEIARVEAHLETCAMCAREFRFEATVIADARGKLQRIAVPPGLHARVWDRVRRSAK